MALNYCVNCGEKLNDGNTHCHACGEAVPQLHNTASEQDEQQSVETRMDEAKAAADQAKTSADQTIAPADQANETVATPAAATPATATPATAASVTTTPAAATVVETTPPPSNPDETEDFSSFADLTGFDVMATDIAASGSRPYPSPDRTDVMTPLSSRTVREFRAPRAEKSYLGLPIKIALAVAAGLLIAAGVGILAQPGTRENIQQHIEAIQNGTAVVEASDTSAQTDISSVESSEEVSDAGAALSEDAAFDLLVTTYDKLQPYNDRVYSCMQTYNSVFLVNDRSQRETAAGIAKSLLAEIDKDIKTLDAMKLGGASPLFDDYRNVRNLLNDQYQRLAVLVESWDISLSYDAPYEHQTEILEPLTRDIGPSGQNTYLEDFDANYWGSRPTR